MTVIPKASLQPHNTLAVDASADYFAEASSDEELAQYLGWYREQNKLRTEPLPLLLLGGGSNLVLSGDFHGFSLKINLQGLDVVDETDDHIWVRVGAGENWHRFVEYCMNFHWWGLENLALIPGNVGAAPVQNIGAYGVELKDCFTELSAVEIQSGVSVIFDRDACRFGYRDSVFKQHLQDKYIITSVTFKLAKAPVVNVSYPALRDAFGCDQNSDKRSEPISPQQVFDKVCEIRASKLPDPADVPNVGSFFKNPVVSAGDFERLREQHEGIVGFVQEQDTVKLAAGWLIDQAGWKGKVKGPVKVHDKQALVLTNPGQGTGPEVLSLAEDIAADIKAKYGVTLEIEPRVY